MTDSVCHIGDCRAVMRELIAAGVKVQTVVTSPPYYGLRDYGCPGQLGLERSPERYLARMRGVFRLVRELLADDGTLWLNMGDSYYSPRVSGGTGGNSTINGKETQNAHKDAQRARNSKVQQSNLSAGHGRARNRLRGIRGVKDKDMFGMPWMLALLLRADGWWLRSDIIWHKKNPMPESVKDRPTNSHEYLFLLSKSKRYYYDHEAIAEEASPESHARYGRGRSSHHKHADGGPGNQTIAKGFEHMRAPGVNKKAVAGWASGGGSHAAVDHAQGDKDKLRAEQDLQTSTKFGRGAGWRNKQNESFSSVVIDTAEKRNKRTVWPLVTEPFSGPHFATFPRALVEPCILAGSRPGDVVFDPFMGSGTVAQVAEQLGRRWLGIDIDPTNADLLRQRLQQAWLPL